MLKNPATFLPFWVYGKEIPIDFLKLLMISDYVSSVPRVLYIAPTFPLPSPVQKIRKLPLGTKNCPLCIPILCSVISLWLCWENDLFLQETLAHSPETLLFDFLQRFFFQSFSLGERVSLPPPRRAPLLFLTFFYVLC